MPQALTRARLAAFPDHLISLGQVSCMIDFAIGQPHVDFFDFSALSTVTLPREQLRDGYYYTAQAGSVELRRTLIDLLGHSFSTVENSIATYGVLQGIDLLVKAYRCQLGRVFLLQPTYKEALNIFRLSGMQVCPIPTDRQGAIDFDELGRQLAESPALIYLVSNLNNPDGRTLKTDERRKFAELCVTTGTPLIEDDVYYKMFFEARDEPSIFELASERSREHRVFRLLSLSKTFMPGLRIGMVECSEAGFHHVIRYKFDFGTSPMLSALTLGLLRNRESFEATRLRYLGLLRSRLTAMQRALDALEDEVSYEAPGGGYFLWLRLPDAYDTDELLRTAHEQGVSFAPASLFRVDERRNFMRLTFGFYDEAETVQGIERLRRALRLYRTNAA